MLTLYNLDLHVHSIYSHDSNLNLERIIKIAKKKGLSGIAITDHNTVGGAVKARSFAGDNFMVIIGSEITTDKGDVIGLFLNENIMSRHFMEVLDEINDQGGLSILPHPYKNKFADPIELIRYVDMVEGMNARIPKKANDKACALSKKFGMRIVAGSDAHTSFEVGRMQTIFADEQTFDDSEDIKKHLLKGKVNVWGSESPYYIRMLSTGIGRYKTNGMTGLANAGLRKVLGGDLIK